MLCLFFLAQIVETSIYVQQCCGGGGGVSSVARCVLWHTPKIHNVQLICTCIGLRWGKCYNARKGEYHRRPGWRREADWLTADCVLWARKRRRCRLGTRDRERRAANPTFFVPSKISKHRLANPFKSEASGRQRTNVLWKYQWNSLNAREHTRLKFIGLDTRFPQSTNLV